MMQHIQFLFRRLAQARAIFADAERRFGEFESPAYISRSTKANVSGQ